MIKVFDLIKLAYDKEKDRRFTKRQFIAITISLSAIMIILISLVINLILRDLGLGNERYYVVALIIVNYMVHVYYHR